MPRWTKGASGVIGIIAGIIMARNLDRADDLFGGPQGVREPIQLIAKSESSDHLSQGMQVLR
jgi:hypothetical protein